MDNNVAMPQTNGATNKIPPSLQNTFLQPPTIDFFQETQPPNCHPSYTASSVSSWEKQQLPVIQNGESVNKQSSVQLSYNESHYQGCPLPAFSLCEVRGYMPIYNFVLEHSNFSIVLTCIVCSVPVIPHV